MQGEVEIQHEASRVLYLFPDMPLSGVFSAKMVF